MTAVLLVLALSGVFAVLASAEIVLYPKHCACVAGEPVTQQGLDTRCELWLDQVFGLKLDFAIENSLPVCLEDGVIERDAQVLPPAVHAAWSAGLSGCVLCLSKRVYICESHQPHASFV